MRLKVSLLLGAVSALSFTAHSALAQQTAANTQAANAGEIEEVVVTAERQSQNIMTVPASIQAETFQELDAQGIHNLTDIQLVTPGYSVTDSSGYTMIFIRGIGNNNFVGPESNVATYTDDVPRLWGQFANTFIDVNRVEVLKGAQGGLYGRNATGGVVNVITLQPSTDDYVANARFSYGSFNTIDAAAYVNIPLDDTLAFSIAAQHDSHDGYIKNIAVKDPYSAANFAHGSLLGVLSPAFASQCGGVFCSPAQTAAIMNSGVDPHNLDTQNTYGADSKLLWEPVNHFKVTLAGDYYFKDDSGGNQNYTQTPAVPQNYLPLGVFADFNPPVAPISIIAPTSLPTEQSVPKKFETATGDNLEQELHDWGGSMTAVWNSPIADISSITAYRANHSILDADLCACSVPAGTAIVNIKRQFYYQEFRAVSTTEGPFHWLGGVTYLADDQAFNTDFVVAPLLFVNTAHAYDKVKNWSVYGQVGYDITSALNFTTSVRWEHETNIATFPTLPTQLPGSANQGLDKLIPSATLSYALDNGTVYLRWARGIQSGGVNPVASPGAFTAAVPPVPLSDGSTFGPEEIDTYEAGYKQSLLNHSVDITGDVFYNRISGLQEAAHAQPAYQSSLILALVDAGNAASYGAEGSINWQALDYLKLGANVGYLEAHYLSGAGFALTPNPFLITTPLGGTVLPNSPKWQVSFTADLDKPITDRFDLIGSLVESHLSSQLFDQTVGSPYGFFIPSAVAPGYWLTNLRIGLETSDGKYSVEAYATNLFDQKYFTYGSVSAESGDLFSWGNPRIIGVELKAKY